MKLFGRYHRRSRPGEMPGTITVQAHAKQPELDVITFGPNATKGSVSRTYFQALHEKPETPSEHDFTWFNVSGLGDADMLRAVGKNFHLHPLVLEDIANTGQRPKAEEYEEYLFIVIRVPVREERGNDAQAIRHAELGGGLLTRQLALCVGKDFLLTFEEEAEDILAPVRERLLQQKGKLYTRGPDYLAYALLDVVIDTYFPLLEHYVERIEDLETSALELSEGISIKTIHELKRELLMLRRIIWPQRDMVSHLLRSESVFIQENTHLYLRDCYDHSAQLLDVVETCRETTTSLVDIFLASQSNKMNEVMKVLTIIATIFIPLSWVAGVYGMNFDTDSPWNMPELAWKFGYLGAMAMMLLIAAGLVWWFWRKGWIGPSAE